ncbi:DUF1660 family phage protein [Brucella gallinifaecis]|uniref:Uncharacterized protein n=1 Tax=Brucella gallinifaecis TaxID=215590 RepID=A0A502BU75_9HYPH|nr:hypothetical protein FHY56_04325 [Brucella gallinifaecis]
MGIKGSADLRQILQSVMCGLFGHKWGQRVHVGFTDDVLDRHIEICKRCKEIRES